MENNKGFSLMELLAAVAVMGVAMGIFVIGPGVARRKEVDKFARILKDEIEHTQTVSMTREGQWQLTVYEEDGDMYCAQEHQGERGWEQKLNKSFIGHSGALAYTKTEGLSSDDSSLGGLYRIYRFDRDTGECIMGSGTGEIKGPGKTVFVTVYEETGRCDIE